jgi:hypothetical protein
MVERLKATPNVDKMVDALAGIAYLTATFHR